MSNVANMRFSRVGGGSRLTRSPQPASASCIYEFVYTNLYSIRLRNTLAVCRCAVLTSIRHPPATLHTIKAFTRSFESWRLHTHTHPNKWSAHDDGDYLTFFCTSMRHQCAFFCASALSHRRRLYTSMSFGLCGSVCLLRAHRNLCSFSPAY